MNFDHDILFEFIPEEDKKSFMAWDNVYMVPNTNGDKKGSFRGHIVAIYRAPFQEKIVVSVRGYENRLKQKERDKKLNQIL
jgi:hypothetical protein